MEWPGFQRSFESRRLADVLRPIALGLFLLLSPAASLAQSWTEFELDLGNGYRIVQHNTVEVVLCDASGNMVIDPLTVPGLGPVKKYAVEGPWIFTHHSGRKTRALFPGDTFQEVDDSVTLYFSVDTRTGAVTGPLGQQGFGAHATALGVTGIGWHKAIHPGATRVIWTVFVAIAAVVLLGLAALAVYAGRERKKRGPAAA